MNQLEDHQMSKHNTKNALNDVCILSLSLYLHRCCAHLSSNQMMVVYFFFHQSSLSFHFFYSFESFWNEKWNIPWSHPLTRWIQEEMLPKSTISTSFWKRILCFFLLLLISFIFQTTMRSAHDARWGNESDCNYDTFFFLFARKNRIRDCLRSEMNKKWKDKNSKIANNFVCCEMKW